DLDHVDPTGSRRLAYHGVVEQSRFIEMQPPADTVQGPRQVDGNRFPGRSAGRPCFVKQHLFHLHKSSRARAGLSGDFRPDAATQHCRQGTTSRTTPLRSNSTSWVAPRTTLPIDLGAAPPSLVT